MKRLLIQTLIPLVLIGIALTAVAQHYYQPDQPGHGLTVQPVGSGYVAQWYVHDGHQQRWLVSDVCSYGDTCPVFAVDANGFPAVAAEPVEAGNIILDEIDGGVLLTYDLYIEGVDCTRLLPGPLPSECINEDGSRNWEYDDSFEASGSAHFEVLVE